MKYEFTKRTAKVGERGQVTVPKSLRARYGVRPGQEVLFEARDDGILIKKVARDDPLRRLVGRVKQDIDVDEYLEQTRGPGWSEEIDG